MARADTDGSTSTPDAHVLDEVWAAIDVPIAVFDLGPDGSLCWSAVNPPQARALGVDFKTLRGRSVDPASPIPLEIWVHEHLTALSVLTERAVFEPEHPDVQTGRWTSRTVTPLLDAGGLVRRLVVTSADVTEQLRLAGLLAQATRTDALGRVASDAAHEFNNLMVAISGYAGLALRSLPPVPSEGARARDQIVEMLRLCDVASSLTRQVLAFTRRQDGARSLVRLDTLASSMERVLQRMLREGVSLEVRASTELWAVKIDPHQVEQVLLHLASHARESMPRGGSLTLEAANVTLTRDEARGLGLGAGDHVVLSLRDPDANLDAAAIQRMFEPRVSSVVTRSDAEVGLASCPGLVRRHNGAISAACEPGRGVVVRLHFPRATEKAAVSGVAVATARLQGTETVLVADPEPTREAVARTLRMLGYTVLDAPSVDDALRLLDMHEGRLHLVVMGVGPAKPEATALLRAVRARDGDVPVLVTAADETSVMPFALVSARVVKLPASLPPTTLAKRVREALDERARSA